MILQFQDSSCVEAAVTFNQERVISPPTYPVVRAFRPEQSTVAVKALLLISVALAGLSLPVAAQTCWRGRPFPTCRMSLITEAGPRLGTQQPFGSFGYALAVGTIRNGALGRPGWGGALDITTGSESGTYLVTAMPRVRVWVNSTTAFEAGAGPALLGPGDSPVGLKGGAALAALNYRDLLVLTLGVEYERTRNGIPSRTALSVGIRCASYCGPPAAVVSGLLALLAGSGS